MDFDDAKENIQPLITGRNASILHASLIETPQELLSLRRQLEQAIHTYEGDDPLEPWYAYITWIEQMYPSGGKESGLDEVLKKCLSHFKREEKYYQDRRMVKLYIKLLDNHLNPTECFQRLFNAGIGTMVADFYICWAYHYDAHGNTRRADEVFKRGIACRAQPLEELQEAHQHFGYLVSQRLLYKDDEEANENARVQLQERRFALTSLRGYHRRANVGSIRTGAAVESFQPGTIKNSDSDSKSAKRRNNAALPVFSDENNTIDRQPKNQQQQSFLEDLDQRKTSNCDGASVVRSIIDATRNQENKHEPGPWNKAYIKKNRTIFAGKKSSDEPVFNIHVDEDISKDDYQSFKLVINVNENKLLQPFNYPVRFYSRNRKLAIWQTPVTIENEPDACSLPRYNKCMLYPRPNREFQPEELHAFKYWQSKNISNSFTKERAVYWSTHDMANMRQYPNFAVKSCPQKHDPALDEFYCPPKSGDGWLIPFDSIYDTKQNQEFQIEELMMLHLKKSRNETIVQTIDMEETIVIPMEFVPRRRSFFPQMRKSCSVQAIPSGRVSIMPNISTINESTLLFKDSSIPVECEEQKLPPSGEQHQRAPLSKSVIFKDPENVPLLAKEILPIEQPKNNTGAIRKTVQSNRASVSSVGAFQPFEIYDDTTQTNLPRTQKSTKNTPVSTSTATPFNDENEFPFKIPMPLSVAAAPAVVTTLRNDSYDVDETCSTQTFNIMLRAELMSTPIVSRKLVSHQEAGKDDGVLKAQITTPLRAPFAVKELVYDVADANICENPQLETATTKSECIAIVVGDESCNSLTHSPLPVKQLSTILETTENGTTQTSTGTSTKSSLSSPEQDIGDVLSISSSKIKPSSLCKIIGCVSELTTVQEQSNESVTATTSTYGKQKSDSVDQHINSNDNIIEYQNDSIQVDAQATGCINKLSMATAIPKSTVTNNTTSSCPLGTDGTMPTSLMRPSLVAITTTEALASFSMLDNFTRLEQREDTAPGFKLRPICFQEDKTDTVPKFVQSSIRDGANEKIDTISKILLDSESVMHLTEDKTETILPQIVQPPPIYCDNDSDDSFVFFAHSPPKSNKRQLHDNDLSIMESPSSLILMQKKFCDQNTPKMNESNLQDIFNGDSLKPHGSPLYPLTTGIKTNYSIDSSDVLVNDLLNIHKSAASTLQPMHSESLILSAVAKGDFVEPELNGSLLQDSCFIPETQQIIPHVDGITNITKSATWASVKEDSKHMLTDSYFSEFCSIKEPPSKLQSQLMEISRCEEISHLNNLARLKDLSLSGASSPHSLFSVAKKEDKQTLENENKITQHSNIHQSAEKKEQSIRTNATIFGTNVSIICDSTVLSHSKTSINADRPKENNKSLNKEVLPNTTNSTSRCSLSSDNISAAQNVTKLRAPSIGEGKRHPLEQKSTKKPDITIAEIDNPEILNPQFLSTQTSATPVPIDVKSSKIDERQTNDDYNNVDSDDGEISIYFKATPKTPKISQHNWDDSHDELCSAASNHYIHSECDLHQTQQMLENIQVDPNINPMDCEIQNVLLENIDFSTFIQTIPTCQLRRHVARLRNDSVVHVYDNEFHMSKLIGTGAYGAVYCGTEMKTGRKYALKQEHPAHCWEYYICLEIESRLGAEELLYSYMKVEYALIGNNSSILISEFSPYGSLITVCNKIKKITMRNVDEYVVMRLACELLDIIDHLHAINVIHADIKADNFLLMRELNVATNIKCMQLIDFGVSIDMKVFKRDQTFTYVNKDNAFKCIEMRQGQPWSYQLDLYGLAGVIHVLLFGKYMDVEQRQTGTWMHKSHVPRYFQKDLWETIFRTLLNIPNCKSMPNLQQLRMLIKEELAERENYAKQKIAEFNNALLQY